MNTISNNQMIGAIDTYFYYDLNLDVSTSKYESPIGNIDIYSPINKSFGEKKEKSKEKNDKYESLIDMYVDHKEILNINILKEYKIDIGCLDLFIEPVYNAREA